MRKYLVVLKQSFLGQLEHRTNNVLWLFFGIIPAFVNYLIWTTVYQDRDVINGFARDDLLNYYLWVNILWLLVGGTWNLSVGAIIRNGELNLHLLKPIHPMFRFISFEQGWKVGSLLVVLPVFIIISIVLGLSFPIQSLEQCIVLIFSVFFGAIIFAFWDMIIGMTAFFIQNNMPMNRLNRILYMILSGQMFPLAFLPAWLASINNWIFFRYTFSFSLEVLFTFEDIPYVEMFIKQIIWVVLIYILFKLIYAIGIKRYEAVGA